jgi:hypothetical protein
MIGPVPGAQSGQGRDRNVLNRGRSAGIGDSALETGRLIRRHPIAEAPP